MNSKNTFKWLFSFVFVLIHFSSFAQQNNKFEETTKNTEQICNKYILAYFNMQFDEMATYMHDDFSFQDPTASLLFGWQFVTPKDTALHFFKTNYSSLLDMKPKFVREFFSGEQAIYEMNLVFSFYANEKKDIISIEMPLVTVLSLKDNKVIEHRDYGDYREYRRQLAEKMKLLNE